MVAVAWFLQVFLSLTVSQGKVIVLRRVFFLCVLLTILPLALGIASGPYIQLKYATFDPLVGEPILPSDLRNTSRPGQVAYYLVQFDGPIESSWPEGLQTLGIETMEYIPDFAFLIRATPEMANTAAHLDHVRWVGLFHAAYRVDPRLLSARASGAVKVQLFPDEPGSPVEAEITQAGGKVNNAGSGANGEFLEADVSHQAIRRVARQRGVSWIEPKLDRKLYNDLGRGIMNVPSLWTGYGLFGSGEKVAVADTGLDTGSLTTISADFAGRVFKFYKLGRPNKWNDPDGHGTHVCGSVLGNGSLSGSNPAAHNYSTSFAGAAPEAQLIIQSVLDASGGLGGIPNDLNQLFQPTYDDGARIHSNSWGAAYAGAYTTDSKNLDTFAWNRKDMTILFAAGNEGIDANSNGIIDADSMSSPATAKNCISVGAIENYRLSGGAQSTYGAYWPSDYPADPIKSDKVSNNSSGMVAFSSRGPCDDGRIKPDVCAPGTNVISARSHVSGAGTLWGVYNADYVYSGGTSMSTPLTAGACALVREYYRTQKAYSMPTSALMKATVINGARDISPGQYGTGAYLEVPVRPNSVEGWGAVDLASILIPSGLREFRYVDYTTGLSTGGSRVYNYTVNGSMSPFRVTLVWTDYPAALSANPALVNDLDLTVTTPGGGTLHGNGTTDRTNNVEGVDVTSAATGSYTVTVSGYNVPSGPQPFALVVSGDLGTPPTATIDIPTAGTTLFGSVTIKGTATSPYFTQYTLEYGAGSSPSTWIAIGSAHTTPVTGGILGTWDTESLANGAYTVRLTVNDSRGLTASAQRTINVLKTSLSGVKGSPNGTSVTLTGKIVTGSKVEFANVMFIEELDRSSGIKIMLYGLPTDSVIGSLVTVTGTIHTSAGVRTIDNPTVIITGSSTVEPVSLINKSVGGSSFNADTPGVTGAIGLNNVSLLIRTWGKVTYVGTDHFYLDDGSALLDGSGHTGIKVSCPGLTLPLLNQYAIAAGISSVEINGSTARRLILPRMQSDLVYY